MSDQLDNTMEPDTSIVLEGEHINIVLFLIEAWILHANAEKLPGIELMKTAALETKATLKQLHTSADDITEHETDALFDSRAYRARQQLRLMVSRTSGKADESHRGGSHEGHGGAREI